MQEHPENYTRFLVVAREPAPAGQASKTSLVLTLPDVPGSLHQALGVFAGRQVNLSKIESRPIPGRPWEYVFYLDVMGDSRSGVAAALTELGALAKDLRVLGAYPARALPSCPWPRTRKTAAVARSPTAYNAPPTARCCARWDSATGISRNRSWASPTPTARSRRATWASTGSRAGPKPPSAPRG